VNRVK